MDNNKETNATEPLPITSPEAMDAAIREVEQQEQLYSIALFDILGFSNLVQNNKTQVIRELYDKLLDLIHRMESTTLAVLLFLAALSLCLLQTIGNRINLSPVQTDISMFATLAILF